MLINYENYNDNRQNVYNNNDKSHSNFNNANKLITLENEIIRHYFLRYIMSPLLFRACENESIFIKTH